MTFMRGKRRRNTNHCECCNGYSPVTRADEKREATAEILQELAEAFAAVQRVRELYERKCKETVDGCSDELEDFLYHLCVALDGEQG